MTSSLDYLLEQVELAHAHIQAGTANMGEMDVLEEAAPILAGEVKWLRAEVEDLRLTLAAEQGKPEGAPSEGWTPLGGMLREFGKVYADGTEAHVYANGRWWRGYRGVLPSRDGPGRRAAIIAEGPAGPKRLAMQAADAAKP